MTREEAVKHLIDIKEWYTHDRDFSYYGDEYHGFSKEENKAIDIAIETLEHEPKWVSCSEKLPRKHEKVLVTGIEAISGARLCDVKVWDVDRWRPESAPSVIWDAWMPLPKPYEIKQKKIPEDVVE